MREQFHDDLQGLSVDLVAMSELVGSALRRATSALLDTDLPLAESVIEGDHRIDALQLEVEERAMLLLARQSPVATDLRVIVTSLRISADLERMGDLAQHLAKLVRLRHPHHVVPAELRSVVVEMGQVAERLVAKVGSVIASRDLDVAGELETDDDDMDRLHRHLFQVILSPGWEHGVEAAVDVTLCGRFYERFADHAVVVARRVVFLVTGERTPTPV